MFIKTRSVLIELNESSSLSYIVHIWFFHTWKQRQANDYLQSDFIWSNLQSSKSTKALCFAEVDIRLTCSHKSKCICRAYQQEICSPTTCQVDMCCINRSQYKDTVLWIRIFSIELHNFVSVHFCRSTMNISLQQII